MAWSCWTTALIAICLSFMAGKEMSWAASEKLREQAVVPLREKALGHDDVRGSP